MNKNIPIYLFKVNHRNTRKRFSMFKVDNKNLKMLKQEISKQD